MCGSLMIATTKSQSFLKQLFALGILMLILMTFAFAYAAVIDHTYPIVHDNWAFPIISILATALSFYLIGILFYVLICIYAKTYMQGDDRLKVSMASLVISSFCIACKCLHSKKTYLCIAIFSVLLSHLFEPLFQSINSLAVVNAHYVPYQVKEHYITTHRTRRSWDHYNTEITLAGNRLYWSDDLNIYYGFDGIPSSGKIAVATGILGFDVFVKDAGTQRFKYKS